MSICRGKREREAATVKRRSIVVVISLVSAAIAVGGEKLDRGLIALQREDGSVFLSWRLLGGDPADIAFKVARTDGQTANSPRMWLTDQEIRPTCFLDKNPVKAGVYGLYRCSGGQCSTSPTCYRKQQDMQASS